MTFPATKSFIDIYSTGAYTVNTVEHTLCKAHAGED